MTSPRSRFEHRVTGFDHRVIGETDDSVGSPMKSSVLVVDDALSPLDGLLTQLMHEGFCVYTADTCASALKRVAYAQPDVVLVNVATHGLDADETCRHITAASATGAVPVIYIVASTAANDELSGFDAGAVDCIRAPVDIPIAMARIRAQASIHRATRGLRTHNERLADQLQAHASMLHAEIDRHRQTESDKRELLTIIRFQSEQLHALLARVVPAHDGSRAGRDDRARSGIDHDLVRLSRHLDAVRDIVARERDMPARTHIETALSDARDALQAVRDGRAPAPATPKPRPSNWPSEGSPFVSLTEREREVLLMLVDGRSSIQIGLQLGLADATIRTYRSRVMRKLGVTSFADVIKLAIKYKLVDLD